MSHEKGGKEKQVEENYVLLLVSVCFLLGAQIHTKELPGSSRTTAATPSLSSNGSRKTLH